MKHKIIKSLARLLCMVGIHNWEDFGFGTLIVRCSRCGKTFINR